MPTLAGDGTGITYSFGHAGIVTEGFRAIRAGDGRVNRTWPYLLLRPPASA